MARSRPKTSLRTYLIGGGLLALLFAGVLLLVVPLDGERMPRDLTKVDPSLAEYPTVDASMFRELLSYRLIRGRYYRYAFDRRVHATMQGRELINMAAGGNLDIHVVRTERNYMDLVVVAEFFRLQGVEGVDLSKGTVRNRAMARIDSMGNLLQLRFEPSMAARSSQGFINDVFANWLKNLSTARPDATTPDDLSRFVIQATDLHGSYSAEIVPERKNANPAILDMKKLAYLLSPSPIQIQESSHSFAWNLGKGHPVYQLGEETLQMGPKEVAVVSTQRYRFQFAEIGQSTLTESALASFTHEGSLYYETGYADGEKRDDRPALTSAEIQARLASVERLDKTQVFELLSDMVRSFNKDRQLAKRVVPTIAGLPAEGMAYRLVLGAASSSGTPEAQDAMRSLYGDERIDGTGKQTILQAFTMMDAGISGENRNFLRDLYQNPPNGDENVRMNASLALGTALRNADDSEIRSLIDREWLAARTLDEKIFVMEMIGNSGDPAFFRYIEQALSAPESILRQKAIYAARFMDTTAADRLLTQTLARDDDHNVRRWASEALLLRKWKDSYYDPMVACITKESATDIRMKCADYAFGQEKHIPALRTLLQSMESGETDKGFRDYIRDRLKH